MSVFTDRSVDELVSALPGLDVPRASAAVAAARVVIVGGSIGGLATAACLRKAGFSDVRVVERSTALQAGAGIGLDDVSVAVLKGLGIQCGQWSDERPATLALQRQRWNEERLSSGRVIERQAYPYFAVYYAQLQRALAGLLPSGCVEHGRRATSHEVLPSGKVQVSFESGPSLECDILVAADGPRSSFRGTVCEDGGAMKYAGYFAWRGTLPFDSLPSAVQRSVMEEYAHYGNCLYLIHGEQPRGHAVLYDMGKGMLNWLVYENRAQPLAPQGQTTARADPKDVDRLRKTARSAWGDALGSVIEATPEPWVNDIYDIAEPLSCFHRGGLVLLGDAAHPITPHMAKGSNLALHDAYTLACAAAGAVDVASLLRAFSEARAGECGRCVRVSRHLGELRSGLLPGSSEPPQDSRQFQALLREPGRDTHVLPTDPIFQKVWDFLEAAAVADARAGLALMRANLTVHPGAGGGRAAATAAEKFSTQAPAAKRRRCDAAPLALKALNHLSLETDDVGRLVDFYTDVFALPVLRRPDFGFGGAWLQLPGNVALHIIERDPAKPIATELGRLQSEAGRAPPTFIRRSHHFAFTVQDISASKAALTSHGVDFAVHKVPGTEIEQLFLYDPDGNGIEVGNFDA